VDNEGPRRNLLVEKEMTAGGLYGKPAPHPAGDLALRTISRMMWGCGRAFGVPLGGGYEESRLREDLQQGKCINE
jgi:hypothetical protein